MPLRIHNFLSPSRRHRCVSIAGGKRRRKHNYYLPNKDLKAFTASPRGALSIPLLFCDTSAGTLAFVLDASLLVQERPHKRLNNVWLSERTWGGLTSAQSFLYSSLLWKQSIDVKKERKEKKTFAHPKKKKKTLISAGYKCQDKDKYWIQDYYVICRHFFKQIWCWGLEYIQ